MKHPAQPAVGGVMLQAAVPVLLHLDHRRLEGRFEAAVTPVYSWPTNNDTPLPIAEIAQRIQLVRGQRVILDADLAAFYGETTKRFNQQVKRNLARFPGDFMFQLDQEEFSGLRLQIATLKTGRGQHRKYAPYVFTEHGAIMAATLLNSPRATEISVHVVRAFVELRGMLATNRELASKLHLLERKVTKRDQSIGELIDAMRQLLAPPDPPRRPIGFVAPEEKPRPRASRPVQR